MSVEENKSEGTFWNMVSWSTSFPVQHERDDWALLNGDAERQRQRRAVEGDVRAQRQRGGDQQGLI